MKMCPGHWAAMKAAIEALGLAALVKTGGSNFDAAVAELTGEDDGAEREAERFDPLSAATWSIYAQCLKDLGLSAMADDDFCPLCSVEASKPGRAKNWIDGSCDEQLERARHLGLAPAVQ